MSCSITVKLVKINKRAKREQNGIYRSGLELITTDDINKLIARIRYDYDHSRWPVDCMEVAVTLDTRVAAKTDDKTTHKYKAMDFAELLRILAHAKTICNDTIIQLGTTTDAAYSGASYHKVKEIADMYYNFIGHNIEVDPELSNITLNSFIFWVNNHLKRIIHKESYLAYIECCKKYTALHGKLSKALGLGREEFVNIIGKLFVSNYLHL